MNDQNLLTLHCPQCQQITEVVTEGDNLVCLRCGMVVQVKKPSTLRPHQLRPLTCQCGQKMSDGPE